MASESRPPFLRLILAWPHWLLRFLSVLVVIYLAWLAVATTLRIRFPWDLLIWPESPFMTNMLKLEQGQPIYTAPTDANSFIYSPGLEYLTYAILKPFRLNLDIRWCRAVNVLFGLMAGLMSGLLIRRAHSWLNESSPAELSTGVAQAGNSDRVAKGFVRLGAGVSILVVFRNFTSDITHPDNLVMLHTAAIFLLTFATVRQRSFSFGLFAMVLAGLGVFAKQTLAISFLGPALLFALLKIWDWRKWAVITGVGALTSIAMLALLLRMPWARFYTLEVLSKQGIHASQFYWILGDSFHADRGLLWVLGLASVAWLWQAGPRQREFLLVWLTLGVFSVWPNAISYLKTMGTWNNLIIFQLWLLLLVWPTLVLWFQNARRSMATSSGNSASKMEGASPSRDGWAQLVAASASAEFSVNMLVAALLCVFVALLVPTRLPPSRSMLERCSTIQARIDKDIKAGLKVLVAHGAMYEIRAGSRTVPLDRANSILELKMARLEQLAGTSQRIRDRYYDRIYLSLESWYSPELVKDLSHCYVVDEVIAQPSGPNRAEIGRDLSLISECKILSPAPTKP